MVVTFPVNVTDVAKFVSGQVSRYTGEERKRKIFDMAKDCAKRLKLPDWDVVVWPPEEITSDVLDIVASLKRCANDTYLSQVA